MNPVSIPAPLDYNHYHGCELVKSCTFFVQSVVKCARSLHSAEGAKSGNATGMVRIPKVTQVYAIIMETLFYRPFRAVPLSTHKVFPASGWYHRRKRELHNYCAFRNGVMTVNVVD